jgi:hypothetical protein
VTTVLSSAPDNGDREARRRFLKRQIMLAYVASGDLSHVRYRRYSAAAEQKILQEATPFRIGVRTPDGGIQEALYSFDGARRLEDSDDDVLYVDAYKGAMRAKEDTKTPWDLGPLVEQLPAPMQYLFRRFSWLLKPSLSPGWLTGMAVLLAGRKRSAVRDEWRSHLAGWRGHGLSRREQVRAARGFMWAALRYRLEDVTDLAWRPIDAVLGSRTLSNLFIWGPVIAVLVAIVRHDGRFGIVADDQDPVALGAFLYVVIKTGRWWRQIKLPEPKPRRVKERE